MYRQLSPESVWPATYGPFLGIVSFWAMARFAVLLWFADQVQSERNVAERRWLTIADLIGILLCVLHIASVSISNDALLGEIMARYLLGFPGAVLAAFSLLRKSPDWQSGSWFNSWIRLFGVCLLIYGATTAITPAAPYFPASVLNYDSVQALVIIPVFVVRTFLAAGMSFSVLKAFLEMEDYESEALAAKEAKTASELSQTVEELRRALDQTEQAEQRAQNNEQRFKDFAESASDWLWEMDSELRFSYVSDLAKKFAGLSIDKMIGTRREDLITKQEDRPKWQPHLDDLHARRPFRDFRYTYVRPDGEERLWSISGKPVYDGDGAFKGYRGTGRDITEQVQTELALAKSEERFRSLIENALDIITVIDADGTILFESPSVEQVLGFKPEELVGLNAFDLMHPDDRERVMATAAEGVKSGKITESIVMRFQHKNGEWREIEAIGRNLLKNESVKGIVINSRDITERNQIAEQLRQAQKMDAIGQLTGGVAHDFNNLLAIIQGNLEIAREDETLTGPVQKNLSTALRAAHRGAELTHRLLAFSRKQTLTPIVVDLNERIGGVVEMLQRLLGETVDVVVETEPELWSCEVDPAQLEVSLVNLGINARDAMPNGGTLTIAARNLNRADGKGFVSLAVSDTGAGIDQSDLDRVFDPFFTTKGVGKGTGLGLSMVYGFIKQSGGNVTIESELGRGTTVTLLLPKSGADKADHLDGAGDQVAMANGERIMVIEDDRDVRDLALSQLKSLGYKTVEASDGASALKLAGQTPDIDLILTDIALPGGMNGQQLAREMTKQLPQLRVLLMSGYNRDSVDNSLTLDDGALLIQKPFQKAELARMLRIALEAN